MNPYEITYIVRPDLDEERIRGVIDNLNGRINQTGELIATYPWNPPRRRMAFPIKDFGDGYYVTSTFNFPPQELREFERGLRLNGNILRFLLVQATQKNVEESRHRAQQYAQRLAQAAQQAAQPQPAPIQAPSAPQTEVAASTQQEAPVPAPAEPTPTPAPAPQVVQSTVPTAEPEAEPQPATVGETEE